MVGEDREIVPETIEEVPLASEITESKPEDETEPLMNVTIELHAQDMDRRKLGWAGIIPAISPDRLRMQIYPTIDPNEIYMKASLKGDVILVSRPQPDGSFKPYLFHLVKLHEAS
ncbi:MAG: hypothetical protein HC868_09935 [Sphingomonadales bacterium]|nr:hypothetical protein [Sphingomonadales bacterium]